MPASSTERRPRRDAQANRERLLAAAVAAVKREGQGVPLQTVAADAGVGIATLYRHFPDRDALLAGLTERSFALVVDHAEAAAATPGPAVAALRTFFEATITRREQLVLPLQGGPTDLTDTARQHQDRIWRLIRAILRRGVEDGSLRADLQAGDVIRFGAMLTQPLANVPHWEPIARRQARIFLAGAGAADDDALSARPLTRRAPR